MWGVYCVTPNWWVLTVQWLEKFKCFVIDFTDWICITTFSSKAHTRYHKICKSYAVSVETAVLQYFMTFWKTLLTVSLFYLVLFSSVNLFDSANWDAFLTQSQMATSVSKVLSKTGLAYFAADTLVILCHFTLTASPPLLIMVIYVCTFSLLLQ